MIWSGGQQSAGKIWPFLAQKNQSPLISGQPSLEVAQPTCELTQNLSRALGGTSYKEAMTAVTCD
jgi:hypothetical protein